jgi:hypothetical protein
LDGGYSSRERPLAGAVGELGMRAIRGWWIWFLRGGWRWAILAVLIVAFLWFVPQLQGKYFSHKAPATERPALVNEYRRTWAQIVGGFGLLLGLYFTWRRIEISQQELEATRDQQVTERFTRAIDQLGETDDKGDKKLEIRLGGIYALERIAVDSFSMENSPGRDYSTVMEVLTAYVRENTREASEPSNGSSDETSKSNESTAEADEGAKQAAPPELPHPTVDIQAILDVLRRTQDRVQDRVPEEYRTRLDLHEANLSGANLSGANLQRADLQSADLQSADLQSADLQEAILQSADLQRADLREAILQGANLSGANLIGAGLQRAKLVGLTLQEADLRKANLQEADLQEADLRGANLSGANLRGAYLPGAILQREQIEGVIGDETTSLPHGLDPPVAWSTSVEEQQRERRPEVDDIERLLEARDTASEWVRFHTLLLRHAVEWESRGRDSSFLLRGSDLREAEEWQARATDKEPELTSLQRQYILASRVESTRRQRRILVPVTFGMIVVIVQGAIILWLWSALQGSLP